MRVGTLYEFYGPFDQGAKLRGRYAGKDAETDFLIFTNIVNSSTVYCVNNISTELYDKYAKKGKAKDSSEIMIEATEYYKQLKDKDIDIPEELIIHKEGRYNSRLISAIFPIDSYISD